MLGLLTRNILIATTFHPCLQGRKSTTPEFGQTLTEVAFVGYHFCKVWMPRPGVRGAFLNMLGSVESRRMVNERTYIYIYYIIYMHLVIYIMNEVVVYVYYINESHYE